MKLIGHQANWSRFERAWQRDRLPSTFLFSGPAGIGKRTFAVELAKSLLCENATTDLRACGECESCILMKSKSHPDFELVSKRENAKSLLLEQFIGDRDHRNRAGLCYNFSLKPNRGNRKVAVIDDADFFNLESANCLLKILEEPPPRSVLIMIGTAVEKLLPTLRSRSQIFHFDPLSEKQVLSVLESLELPPIDYSLEDLAAGCGGSLQGLSRFFEEGMLEFQSQLYRTLAGLEPSAKGFPKELLGFVEQAGKEPAKRRKRLQQIADMGVEFFRALARSLCGAPLPSAPSLRQSIELAVSNWKTSPEAATDCVERCLDLQNQVAANSNQATLAESWLSDLGKLSRGDAPYSLIKAQWHY